METGAQVFSGIATVALLLGGAAGFGSLRAGRERSGRLGRLALGSAAVGVSLLLIGILLRGVAAATQTASHGWSPLASVGDRATLVSLIAGLLQVGPELRRFLHPGRQPPMGPGLIPLAVVTGVGTFDWPTESTPAPVLLVGTLLAAGLGLWSAGQALDVLAQTKKEEQTSLMAVSVGLTLNLLLVGGVNWRVWGTVSGASAPWPDLPNGFLHLSALWLISAAGLVLRNRSARLARVLTLLAATLLVGTALSVRWILPFS
jgi:hypothetical protein